MLGLHQVSKSYHSRSGRSLILDKVDLTIDRSEHVGILGRNGSGKSTLIRLIGGSEYPSSGEIVRNMTVSWPLAFSGGFQSSLTGLDNLRFICRIYDTAYDDALPFVEEFTELGSHLREPVRNYSNGMRARLAFAMSMAIEFDCFLIDEVIAVGDARFQAKCHEELFERRRDRAMLMVSHDPHMIRDHCSRACVLENNTLREFPDVDSAFAFYNEFIMQPRRSIASQQLTSTQPVSPAGPAQKRQKAIQAAPSPIRSPANSVSMADTNWKEQIITAFYRVLLGRDPEPEGLRHHMGHLELLAQRDGKTAVEQTLKMFLGSDEAKNKSLVLFPDTLGRFQNDLDHIVSLGTHCYTSAFMKRFHLKKFSSAFDWTFSSPAMIAHAINDDFETFLDPQYYLPVSMEERRDGAAVNRVQHEFYRKQYGVNFVFNHHDVHEPADYAYLTRCVERLRTSLRAGDKTLFLLIRREDESTPRDFELIRTSLKQAAPGTRFIFVAVAAQVTGSRMPSVSVVQQDSCSTLYRFAASSEWKALSFADPFDDICLFRTVLNAADSLR